MIKPFITILSILMACLCGACTNEDISTDDIASGEDIVIRLDISSRAEGSSVEASNGTEITNLKVWMVKNGETKAAFYKEYDTPEFDADGIFTLTETVYIPQEGKFDFYVLANSSCLSTDAGLNGEMDVTSLERASFSEVIGGSNTRRDIPMFGKYQSLYIPLTQQQYEVEIPITRMLAKVETFFARTSSDFALTINKVDLNRIPNKGYVAPQPDLATKIDTYTGSKVLSSAKMSITGTSDNLDDDVLEKNFQPYSLGAPFIFENPFGCGGSVASLTEGDERGYQMNISYTVDGTAYEQAVYLPKVERNTIYKVYCLVDEKGMLLKLNLVSRAWQGMTEEWDYTDNIQVKENGMIAWQGGVNPTEKAEVIMEYGTDLTCTFGFDAPVDGEWYASLIPVEGKNDAFRIVGPSSGKIDGELVLLTIRANYPEVAVENNMARLQIAVRTWDGRTLIADLCGMSDGTGKYEKYTIVQNINK